MEIENQPLVSVVTPVYNGEPYLAECIESILTQTYKNWEYIIFNNCSTDRSLQIADAYQIREPRIRVYDNAEFLPMLGNQNRALRQISADSKYCKIVFADDFLFPECLTQMVKLAEENPSVGLVGSYGLGNSRVLWDGLPYPKTVVPGREVCKWRLCSGLFSFGTASSVLYRSDIVRSRNPFYDERNIHSDTSICYEILQFLDFGFVHQILSYSRENEGTASTLTALLRSNLPMCLGDLISYGPIYLSSAEHKRAIKVHMHKYYEFLAASVFRLREIEFWRYHKHQLAELGYPINYYRLIATALFVAVREIILNPSRATKELVNILRMKRHRLRHHPAAASMPLSIKNHTQF